MPQTQTQPQVEENSEEFFPGESEIQRRMFTKGVIVYHRWLYNKSAITTPQDQCGALRRVTLSELCKMNEYDTVWVNEHDSNFRSGKSFFFEKAHLSQAMIQGEIVKIFFTGGRQADYISVHSKEPSCYFVLDRKALKADLDFSRKEGTGVICQWTPRSASSDRTIKASEGSKKNALGMLFK